MTEILELSGNDFKAAITKMLQWEIMNMFGKKEKKVESIGKEDIKNWIKILELKNTINWNKLLIRWSQ